jgi:hypothetical protein
MLPRMLVQRLPTPSKIYLSDVTIKFHISSKKQKNKDQKNLTSKISDALDGLSHKHTHKPLSRPLARKPFKQHFKQICSGGLLLW